MKAIKDLIQSVKNRVFHYKGPNPPLKVIITGPPRSGTSFLAGLIVRMGFSPGPKEWLWRADKNNPSGYYECTPLMKIDHNLLKKLGGSVMDPPKLPDGWTRFCDEEKEKIRDIVVGGGLEVYKGNMLVILADLYAELFPDAKWIMICRDEEEIVRSINASSKNKMSAEELKEILRRWLEGWNRSKPSSHCLTIRYEDFFEDTSGAIKTVAGYLELDLTDKMFRDCEAFFIPRSAR